MENSTENSSGGYKNIIYIIIALVIIIGGIVWYMNSKNGSSVAINEEATTTNMEANASAAAPTSLRALFAAGGAQQCTFQDNATSGIQTSGTVYVANGKMRGDFASTVSGKTTSAHMMMDGTYVYSWVDGMTSGFKMAMSATASQSGSTNKSVDLDKPANIVCSKWGADFTKFQLPTGITFSDMTSMMQNTTGTQTNTNGSANVRSNTAQCGYCDQLPTDQKAQCRAALNCK